MTVAAARTAAPSHRLQRNRGAWSRFTRYPVTGIIRGPASLPASRKNLNIEWKSFFIAPYRHCRSDSLLKSPGHAWKKKCVAQALPILLSLQSANSS